MAVIFLVWTCQFISVSHSCSQFFIFESSRALWWTPGRDTLGYQPFPGAGGHLCLEVGLHRQAPSSREALPITLHGRRCVRAQPPTPSLLLSNLPKSRQRTVSWQWRYILKICSRTTCFSFVNYLFMPFVFPLQWLFLLIHKSSSYSKDLDLLSSVIISNHCCPDICLSTLCGPSSHQTY